ncbi:MAG: hemolysin III family protein [Myxococcaceae bacterium]
MDQSIALPEKPLLRGVIHQVFFFVSLLAGAVLVAAAPFATARLACAAYALSLASMLGVSALYHRPTWSPAARQRMRRLDHSAIFVLIAGTWTPLALTLPSSSARVMLTVAWSGAALGVIRAVLWIHAPKWVVAVLALAMGWLAVLYLPGIGVAAGMNVVAWIVLGGVFYSSGALIYALKRPNPWPRVFGYHEIFHALVVAAAVAHFIGIVSALKAMS